MIMDRINEYDFEEKAYYLRKLSDTIWLVKNDSIYEKNGVLYHKEYLSRGYLPNNLKPNKLITIYSIIDLRNYERGNRNFTVYDSMDRIVEFIKKRNELGVSSNLDFTIVNERLK